MKGNDGHSILNSARQTRCRILSQTKFQQLPQTKSNKFTRKRRKFKAVQFDFEETVAMRIQDLELKK
jgi:hypothetical protein